MTSLPVRPEALESLDGKNVILQKTVAAGFDPPIIVRVARWGREVAARG